MPDSYWAERTYIVHVIFEEFLGFQAQIRKTSRPEVTITAGDHRQLVLADTLFSLPSEIWLSPASLPLQPLSIWELGTTRLCPVLTNTSIPIIFGQDPNTPQFFQHKQDAVYLGLDILGSAFFMLTRYEEVVKTERDPLDRFPASASLAYQEHFIRRPIINEYIEILWACMLLIWPSIERHPHHSQTYVSHDVDEPFRYAFSGPQRLLRRCIGDMVHRKSLRSAASSVASYLAVKQGNFTADPCNTFDFIMQTSEQQGLQSTFYFIADHTSYPQDGDYDLSHPLIRALLTQINKRGHKLGLHTSFNTYRDSQQTRKEFTNLRAACAQADIYQDKWGGRQHCLRWSTPKTWQNLQAAGLSYDSTLTFPECVGFRCGTCFEYPVFDVSSGECLQLYERPLIVMDATILEKNYMNLDITSGDAFQMIKKMKDRCYLFGGNFTLLWHNSRLTTKPEQEIYRQILIT